jgi:hypothetical protein
MVRRTWLVIFPDCPASIDPRIIGGGEYSTSPFSPFLLTLSCTCIKNHIMTVELPRWVFPVSLDTPETKQLAANARKLLVGDSASSRKLHDDTFKGKVILSQVNGTMCCSHTKGYQRPKSVSPPPDGFIPLVELDDNMNIVPSPISLRPHQRIHLNESIFNQQVQVVITIQADGVEKAKIMVDLTGEYDLAAADDSQPVAPITSTRTWLERLRYYKYYMPFNDSFDIRQYKISAEETKDPNEPITGSFDIRHYMYNAKKSGNTTTISVEDINGRNKFEVACKSLVTLIDIIKHHPESLLDIQLEDNNIIVRTPFEVIGQEAGEEDNYSIPVQNPDTVNISCDKNSKYFTDMDTFVKDKKANLPAGYVEKHNDTDFLAGLNEIHNGGSKNVYLRDIEKWKNNGTRPHEVVQPGRRKVFEKYEEYQQDKQKIKDKANAQRDSALEQLQTKIISVTLSRSKTVTDAPVEEDKALGDKALEDKALADLREILNKKGITQYVPGHSHFTDAREYVKKMTTQDNAELVELEHDWEKRTKAANAIITRFPESADDAQQFKSDYPTEEKLEEKIQVYISQYGGGVLKGGGVSTRRQLVDMKHGILQRENTRGVKLKSERHYFNQQLDRHRRHRHMHALMR